MREMLGGQFMNKNGGAQLRPQGKTNFAKPENKIEPAGPLLGKQSCSRQERLQESQKSVRIGSFTVRLPASEERLSANLKDAPAAETKELCRAIFRADRRCLYAMDLLSALHLQAHEYRPAMNCLQHILRVQPGQADAEFLRRMVIAATKCGDLLMAFQSFGRLFVSKGWVKKDQLHLARLYKEADIYAGALAILANFIAEYPRNLEARHLRAGILRILGTHEEASKEYEIILDLDERNLDAIYSLINAGGVERLSHQTKQWITASSVTPESQHHLYWFCRARVLEIRGELSDALASYEVGNRLIRNKQFSIRQKMEMPSSAMDKSAAFLNQTRATFIVDCHEAETGTETAKGDTPIFIVGLPRSGSTLLEQIISSHPDVDGTHELSFIPSFVRAVDLIGRKELMIPYPEAVLHLRQDQWSQLRKEYLRQTLQFRGKAPYFTDKMLNNFKHVGFMKKLFPGCHIIEIRRNPFAAAMGSFRQIFPNFGYQASYDLDEMALFYHNYVETMKVWQETLPGSVISISYEKLLGESERVIKTILHRCGLPWHEQCMAFHKTERAVRTMSNSQVRQPINDESIARYEAYLALMPQFKKKYAKLLSDYADWQQNTAL